MKAWDELLKGSPLPDLLPVGLYVVDAVGAQQYANRRATDLWQEDRFEGKFYRNGRPVESPVLRAIQEDKPAYGVEAEMDCHGGRLPVLMDVGILRDEIGMLAGATIIFQDMTPQRRLIEQIQEQADRLAETDRRKDDFLAMLSHELRNPLSPILAAVQVCRRREDDADPLVRDSHNMIERQVKHIARMLDDLLDVARLTRGKITLQKRPLELHSIITRAVEQVRGGMEMRYHTLHLSLPFHGVWVEGDQARLEQVVTNVLSNASKYTEPCGHIWVNCQLYENEVSIHVRDNGIGISQKMLPQIFDLFVQAERRTDRAVGGLGVGLTMVKQLVELHGGRVEARSEGLNQGSEFIITLPVVDGDDEAVEFLMPRQVEPEFSGGEAASFPQQVSEDALRILVVDDNVDAADSLTNYLRMEGYDVWVANDGPAAIRVAAEFEPDVVLLDIGLPYMDGFKVCEELRKNDGQLKVIAITGYGQEQDRRRAKEVGFDNYLIKPVEPQQVADLIAAMRENM